MVAPHPSGSPSRLADLRSLIEGQLAWATAAEPFAALSVVLRRSGAALRAAKVVAVTGRVLKRSFFDRPAAAVAPDLLGCVVEHETAEGLVAVRLTEVEAYQGDLDPGSHAYRGRTPRNSIMFGEPGYVYVYFTYGMHYCMNLVCDGVGTAAAVLLRAGEVVEGVDLATRAPRLASRAISPVDPRVSPSRSESGEPSTGSTRAIRLGPLRVRQAEVGAARVACSPARGSDCQRARRPPGASGWTASRRSLRTVRHVEKRRPAKPSER